MNLGIKTTIFALIYMIGAWTTYGYVFNLEYASAKKAYPDLGERVWEDDARVSSIFPAYVWPIYWPGALMVTYFQYEQSIEN